MLKSKNINFDDKYIFVDVFGGSGALTIIFKTIFKNNDNIYIFNDYDEIITNKDNKFIIDENIKKANKIINEIKKYINVQTDKTFEKNDQIIIKDILKKHTTDLNDKMIRRLISSNIMFNSRMLDIENIDKMSFYNRLKKTEFKNYEYNFKDVQIIHKDFKELLNKKYIDELINKYNIKKENIILLLDPPYLNFDMKSSYKTNFWTLYDYLKVLETFYIFYDKFIILFEHPDNNISDIFKFINDIINKTINNKKIDEIFKSIEKIKLSDKDEMIINFKQN
jgi:hypothetical protein